MAMAILGDMLRSIGERRVRAGVPRLVALVCVVGLTIIVWLLAVAGLVHLVSLYL